MSKEEWKDVKGYEGLYQVSSLGRVFSIRSNRCLQAYRRSKDKPYLTVSLCVNNERKHYKVHRLVAEAFIPNPDNLEYVNHINEDGADNRVENLEWCTAKYNNNYGTRIQRVSKALGIPVDQYSLNGEFIKTWDSANEASKKLSIYSASITRVCKGENKTAGGYKWQYHEKN